MEIIDQGVTVHKFFSIAQPAKGLFKRVSIYPNCEKPQFILRHPRTNEEIKTELHDVWLYDLSEIPEGFCKLVYGISSADLVPKLINKYPELKHSGKVEFLLLKKL